MKIEDLFSGVAGVVNRFPKAILSVMLVLAVIAMFFMTAIPAQTMSDEVHGQAISQWDYLQSIQQPLRTGYLYPAYQGNEPERP